VPSTRQNTVGTVVVPVIFREKVLSAGELNSCVIWTLLASGRWNNALKYAVALLPSWAVLRPCASFDSMRAVESSAICMEVRTEAARL
jgi:hypothetical protein